MVIVEVLKNAILLALKNTVLSRLFEKRTIKGLCVIILVSDTVKCDAIPKRNYTIRCTNALGQTALLKVSTMTVYYLFT